MPEKQTRNQLPNSAKNFPIISIEIDSQDLDAFKKFIQNIAADSGIAYVLTWHSILPNETISSDSLSKLTSLPIVEITDTINLVPNTISILPKNTILTTFDGTHKLVSIFENSNVQESKNFANSIDEKVAFRTEELTQSHTFLESILNAIQDVVYVYDFEQQKIIFINENIFEATGFSPKKIQESSYEVYKSLVHPDDLELFESHRERIKDQNEGISQVEYRLKSKDGKWTNIISRDLVFKRDSKGNSIQYIAATTDISDIKSANERLLQNNQQLEYKNQELASFTSIASHDLKEPLRKISIFSKLISDRESEGLTDNAKYNLNRIIVSSDRMQQLVDDLLSYSQINVNDIVYTKTNLNVLLDKVQSNLKETIEEKNTTIEISKLPTISTIPSQFQQVFDNLLSNAMKYSRTNQAPKIKIYCQKITGGEIKDFGADISLDYYKIAIEDNGIGFPDAFKEKIFEPFKRLHGKDEFSGTGIGLAICKKIIMSHKGFITAESDEKIGSVFMIYLPA